MSPQTDDIFVGRHPLNISFDIISHMRECLSKFTSVRVFHDEDFLIGGSVGNLGSYSAIIGASLNIFNAR